MKLVVHDPLLFVSRLVLRYGLAVGVAVGGPSPAPAEGQTATLRVEENVRAAPNEVVLAVAPRGAELPVVGRRSGWVEVELGGWVWIRSLQVVDRDGFDLVVVPEEADADIENLRTRPAGPIVASLVRGALLSEQERIPGWVRVQRRAWIWAASVEVTEGAPSADGARQEPDASAADAAPAGGAGAPRREVVRAGRRGTPILAAPDGDTLARAQAGADLSVLARQGNWARVRLDGWVFMPDTVAIGDTTGVTEVEATPDRVAADPLPWRGRIVTWTLQFISLERAEAVRTDFYEGEPFLLTRPLGDSAVPFVYVALPPELLEEVRGLQPLQRITVRGRIRVGSSSLTGGPILDLVELRRERRP